MIFVIGYLISLILAPILAGILDRKYDSGYPAGDFIFVLLSPIMCFLIVLAYITYFVVEHKQKFENINFFETIYQKVKGNKE